MPIYEFYCPACHVIMNFFARGVNPTRKPKCPHCGGRRLQRQVSMFAAGGAGGGDDEALDAMPVDERRMERAMESLAGDAEVMNEDDPQAAARLMRRFSKMTGVEFNAGIEQALQRMEAGEDPEMIEAEMGGALEADEPFILPGTKGPGPSLKPRVKQRGAPRRDPSLYDL